MVLKKKIGHSYVKKKMNLDTYLKLFTKINWRWIISLNVKFKIIKVLKVAIRKIKTNHRLKENVSKIKDLYPKYEKDS